MWFSVVFGSKGVSKRSGSPLSKTKLKHHIICKHESPIFTGNKNIDGLMLFSFHNYVLVSFIALMAENPQILKQWSGWWWWFFYVFVDGLGERLRGYCNANTSCGERSEAVLPLLARWGFQPISHLRGRKKKLYVSALQILKGTTPFNWQNRIHMSRFPLWEW